VDPDEMDAMVRRLELKLLSGYSSMVRGIKDDNSLHELAQRLANGDLGNLIMNVDAEARAFATELQQGFVAAGQRAARAIDSTTDRPFRFDIAGQDSVGWMRRMSSDMNRIIEEQQAVARRVAQLTLGRGGSFLDAAEEIRASIGLNVAQVDQVARYRQALEGGDYRRAQSYKLADGRYDDMLDRLLDSGAFLGPERIDAMVARYRDNWVRSRGETIALTEAQHAVHEGVKQAIDQAGARGMLVGVKRIWRARGDHRVRRSHRFMSGQVRDAFQAFLSGNGNHLMYPGDPAAPPEDVVNCRCVVEHVLPKSTKKTFRLPYDEVLDLAELAAMA
jgi:hypothetical protein